ncbi:OPT family oligopeptide transporter [Archangium primigenium]|uniref:OPT family oligopeptide transporter n=1 Tax=[Archangium] primigenium TaxID=2792470 RepID=UPI00195ADBCB|nr:oligopeptide transporter, OPT family [Archangium primigenium]
MSHSPPPVPHVPATESPAELTPRGLVLGSVLGIVFGAASVFMSVKVGLTVSASIPVAVLSIAIFRAWGRSSVLENTIVQTVGSAGESLAFGVAAALPALLLLGYDIDLWHAFLVSALGGVLGVLMMIPLREGLIVQEHGTLTYPEGTAAADVLIAGESGGTSARTILWGFAVGGLYKFAYAGLRLFKEVVGMPLSWVRTTAAGVSQRVGYAGGSLSLEVSPELLGVGYIIGPKVAGITFAGGVLSYLILIPLITFIGAGLDTPLLRPDGQLIRDMDPDTVRDAYVLYIGAGAVATGGLVSLVRSLPTLLRAFRGGLATLRASRRARTDVLHLPRTERDLPLSVVLVGSALLVLAMWWAPPLHINLLSALLIVVCGFFFVTVSARVTGEIGSSSNPISGMVVATLLFTCLVYLLLGWTSAEDRFMALTTAAIVGIAASNGGTTAQDLKTAFLVGGTPRSQQVALFVGVLTSSLFIGGVLVVLNRGATAILPEPHPGERVSVLTEATRTQQRYPWAVSAESLAARGVTAEQLKGPLWRQGLELGAAPNGWELRGWTPLRVEDVADTDVRLPSGESVKVAALGAVRQAPERVWRVGHVRGADTSVPPGTYLVDEAERIQYVVDPGIGGRVTSYEGQPLTRYPAPKAQLFALIIDGILTHKLPWDLVLVGVFISLMLELCGVSSLPFAVGVYLPLSSSAPIFVGGLVRALADRARGGATAGTESESDFSPGSLLSSGYIAGGAIAGVLIAGVEIASNGAWTRALDIPGWLGDTALAHLFQESDAWGLAVFTALTLGLLVTALRRRA